MRRRRKNGRKFGGGEVILNLRDWIASLNAREDGKLDRFAKRSRRREAGSRRRSQFRGWKLDIGSWIKIGVANFPFFLSRRRILASAKSVH